MKTLRFLIFAWTTSVLPSIAQSDIPSTPKSPIVRRAPDFASWTITFTSAKTANPQQPVSHFLIDRPQSISVRKTGRTYQEVTIFQSGKKSERWICDGIELDQLPGSDQVSMVRHNDVVISDAFDFSKGDFQRLDWLSLDNFKGIQNYEGKPVFVFEAKIPTGNGKSGDKRSAMLDAKTQLPLVTRDSNWVLSYTFTQPPGAALVPPDNFLKAFKDMGVDFK